jgi:hypothetical protein
MSDERPTLPAQGGDGQDPPEPPDETAANQPSSRYGAPRPDGHASPWPFSSPGG